MTGQLRTSLHTHADALEAWDVDLDTLLRAGDRRLRRRRASLAGGLAGVLVLAGGIAAFGGRDHRTSPTPAEQDAHPLTYAVGGVIHSGGTTIDVGTTVRSLVVLKAGFVYSGPDRTVSAWHDGHALTLGHLASDTTRLVASDDGYDVAWWDGQQIDAWPNPVGPADRVLPFPGPDPDYWETPHTVEALSAGHMWIWDSHATWVTEMLPLSTHGVWKDSGLGHQQSVVDAAGDQILVNVGGGLAVTTANLRDPERDTGAPLVTDLGSVAPQVPNIASGDLAPDGRHWFSADHDQFAVFDSTTGRRLAGPTLSGFSDALPYQWLDADTVAAYGHRDSDEANGLGLDAPISLLVCQVSTATCRLAAADIGNRSNLAIPDGLPLDTR